MAGRRVLLTHSEGRLEGLAAALEALGFGVTHHPLVRTEFLPKTDVIGIADLLRCDWLLFASRTAVQAWAALGLPLGAARIGVVGAATALELKRMGGEAALTAEPENARGLLTTFCAHVTPPARVGLPCGEQALPTLATGLARAGFAVSKVHLYRTVPQPLQGIDTDIHPAINADVIVLASPSAVSVLPDDLDARTRLVALGPSTRLAAEKRGWHAVQAQTPDVSGVVRALHATLPARSRIPETP